MHAAAALFTILFSNVELIENNHKQGLDGVGGVMVLELFSLPFNWWICFLSIFRCELFCLAVDLTTNYINKHSFFFFSFVEEKLDESETADKNELGEITKTSQQKTESVVHIKVR